MQYTDKQYEIGDFILKSIIEDGNNTDRDSLQSLLTEKYGWDTIDPDYMLASLDEDLGLIKNWGQARIRITPEGVEAERTGLRKYLKKKERLGRASDYAVIVAICASVASVLSLVVSIIALIK